MEFGGYMLGAFKLMAKLKGLRGTALDIFGYSAERRMERGLIDELNKTIDTLLETLSNDNLEHAVEIIDLATRVRGYGHVKEKNYQQYRLRLEQQLSSYTQKSPINSIQVEVSNVA